jgi:antitoxin HigA-1
MTSKTREPTHPGTILRLDVLPAINQSITAMATDLGVTRQILHRIMAGKAPVTVEMALRLGKYCGNGPNLWLELQRRYDLWHAERKLSRQVSRIRTVGGTACTTLHGSSTIRPTRSARNRPRPAPHRHGGGQ